MTETQNDNTTNEVGGGTIVEAAGDQAIYVTDQIEIFVHATGNRPAVVMASAEESLREVLVRSGLEAKIVDHHVFVGECEEALSETVEVEEGVDTHATVDINLKLAVLELEWHRHVNIHCCRHIVIDVNFGGETKRHKFSPNTTVGIATEWARKKFQLDPALACEFVLQQCGSTVQPRSDEHLGDVVKGESCSACFDLVKEMTPKG